MENMISINGQDVTRIVYKNEPVITLPMIDQLHERIDRTAQRNFQDNREQFIENEDFFMVPYEEWNQILVTRLTCNQDDLTAQLENEFDGPKETWGGHRGEMIFLTLNGYLLLVKTFRDDLSWQIQRTLVRSYFSNHISISDKNRLKAEHCAQLMLECRVRDSIIRFQKAAQAEADRIKRTGGDTGWLSRMPEFKEAVEDILRREKYKLRVVKPRPEPKSKPKPKKK